MAEISVILPTYGRHRMLQDVYVTLLQQEGLAASDYEIIIIADGLDEPEKLDFVDQNSPVKLIYKRIEHGGPAVARNYGVTQSSSPIILFLGNDTKAKPDLLHHHVHFHTQNQRQACLGKISSLGNKVKYNLEHFLDQGSQFHFPETDGVVDFWHFYTANISLPRDLFTELGGFREEFNAAGWEDSEFGYRFSKQYSIFYYSQAEVTHIHPVTFESFQNRQQQLGRDAHLLLDIHPELDKYFKIRHYPFLRFLKSRLASPMVQKIMLTSYPFFDTLAYSRIVHYYFRMVRYHYFFAGYKAQ